MTGATRIACCGELSIRNTRPAHSHTQEVKNVSSVQCKFIDKNGMPSGAPLQGQMILYFGTERNYFRDNFRQFGQVLYA